MPLDQWALAIKDQDVPSLFRSRPKLNYSRTTEEFFNSQVADNKGNVRMPSAFETDQNLDRYLALNLQGPQFDESGNLISPASPMFNTAISQRAIDQQTSFQSVYNDPFESAQAREDFEETFRGMVSDFRATQPKKEVSQSLMRRQVPTLWRRQALKGLTLVEFSKWPSCLLVIWLDLLAPLTLV